MPRRRRDKIRRLRVVNETRECTLITHCRVADGLWSRMKGLIGSHPLSAGEGLLITPCNSVHTHFMGFPIDVIYLDREHRVVAIDHDMSPWRIGRIWRRAHCVLEVPAGTALFSNTQPGDQLRLEGLPA